MSEVDVKEAGSIESETVAEALEVTVEPVEQALGRVGTPKESEATSQVFYFWAPEDRLVEKTQLVHAVSGIGDQLVHFYGLVSEVFRRSRRGSMLEEADRFDGRPDESLHVQSRGVTYAQVRVLAAEPNFFTPPREESLVYPAIEEHARRAYGVDRMGKPLCIGMIRNGGDQVAGQAFIDLDYLLGTLGGHMNVGGIAGVGTKSSFLTIALSQILRWCDDYAALHPSDPDHPQVKGVILNVKGFDLFWLDHWSTEFTLEDREMWQSMGVNEPRPLSCDFHAPQEPGTDNARDVGRPGVQPYSWTLEDVLLTDLFEYIFAEGDREDDNFALLVADVQRILVREWRDDSGIRRRQLNKEAPRTFDELFKWFEDGLGDNPDTNFLRLLRGQHHPGTLRRFFRRLRRVVYESSGIFRIDVGPSHPLDLNDFKVGSATVVDIASLPDNHLQRFVVAALLKQAKDLQTSGKVVRGMHYLFLLDELNRFAPRGNTDPITKLLEEVAGELRSRGVILVGAQQQASLVSARVVENSSIRVLGRTGGHELDASVYSFLPQEMRDYVQKLDSPDKVVFQPSFREPMNVRVPRAPWAMRRAESSLQLPPMMEGAPAPASQLSPARVPRKRAP